MIIGEDRLFADAISVTLGASGFTVTSIVRPSEDVVLVVESEDAEIVLVEVEPSGAGLDLGAEIARRCGDSRKVVALTQAEDPRLIERSVRMGFSGYLTKAMPRAQFVRSIETIADGHLVVPRPQTDPSVVDRGPLTLLTSREHEVLTLLVRGATSAQIAGDLEVSDHTVRTHMQNIFAKLGVRSRVQAAAIAVKHGVR
jgi:two-component system nitrate/nitrite response regulator NarL